MNNEPLEWYDSRDWYDIPKWYEKEEKVLMNKFLNVSVKLSEYEKSY